MSELLELKISRYSYASAPLTLSVSGTIYVKISGDVATVSVSDA